MAQNSDSDIDQKGNPRVDVLSSSPILEIWPGRFRRVELLEMVRFRPMVRTPRLGSWEIWTRSVRDWI